MLCAECKVEGSVVITDGAGVSRCVACYTKPKEKPSARAVVAPAKTDFSKGFRKRADRGICDS